MLVNKHNSRFYKSFKKELEDCLEVSEEILANCSGRDFNLPHDFPALTFQYLMERLAHILNGVKLNIIGIEKNPHLDIPTGIMLRSGLLDFIIVLYLMSYTHKPEELLEKSEEINCDQLRFAIGDLKSMYDSGYSSKQEYVMGMNNLYNDPVLNLLFKEKPNYFGKPERSLIYKDSVSTKMMFKRIKSSKGFSNYSEAFDYYSYYSKFEHFGLIGYSFSRKFNPEDLPRTMICTSYIAKGILLCIAILKETYKENESLFKKLKTSQENMEKLSFEVLEINHSNQE